MNYYDATLISTVGACTHVCVVYWDLCKGLMSMFILIFIPVIFGFIIFESGLFGMPLSVDTLCLEERGIQSHAF